MPGLSVIMPVYNTGPYIDAAIQSVLRQSYTDLELILVDDGSRDESPQKCEEWKAKDSRIRVLHQANAGQSAARNAGLQLAQGRYIGFVDSDDLVAKEMYSTLLNPAEAEQLDFVRCRFGRFTGQRPERLSPEFEQAGPLHSPGEIHQRLFLPLVGGVGPQKPLCGTVCTTVFKAELLREQGLLFPNVRSYQSEDLLFNLAFLLHAKKGLSIGDVLYYYRMHPASFSHQYSPETLRRLLRLDEKLQELCRAAIENPAEGSLRLDNRLLDGVSVCAKEAALLPSAKQAKKQLAALAQNPRLVKAFCSPAGREGPRGIRLFCLLLRRRQYTLFRMLIRAYTGIGRLLGRGG